MKACIIQPLYSVDYSRSEELFRKELELLDSCDSTMDLIVMPEASDVPCLAHDRAEYEQSYRKFGPVLLEKCRETARRCNAAVFVNATYMAEGGERNTTYVIDRKGETAGLYFKRHLTAGEVYRRKLDSDYTFDFSEPEILELDGLRYAFLTCYDFYFYEAFSNIARQNVDIIIGCSHQRSDCPEALELMSRFISYNTNAYLIRSSVTLSETSGTGGSSMIVGPDGHVLAQLGNHVGMVTAAFDPKQKYYKPAGFGNPPAAHYEYIEAGRRPWQYRPGGSFISRTDEWMKYPRICAYRGLAEALPENSLPALSAAVSLGAGEIGFDVLITKDGEFAVVNGAEPGRVMGKSRSAQELTLSELKALDLSGGAKGLSGLAAPTLGEVLEKLSCHAVMNIRLGCPESGADLWNEEMLRKLLHLVQKYDCRRHEYFACGDDRVLKRLHALDEGILLCLTGEKDPDRIAERAGACGCRKVQLERGYCTKEIIDRAHALGIRVNYDGTDDADEARRLFAMGADTILTDRFRGLKDIPGEFR